MPMSNGPKIIEKRKNITSRALFTEAIVLIQDTIRNFKMFSKFPAKDTHSGTLQNIRIKTIVHLHAKENHPGSVFCTL